KIFIGHVLNLIDKGIEVIYCPSIQSIEPKIYNCSKIRGLPDLVRNVVKRNYLLIEPTFDMSEVGQTFEDCLYQSIKPLGIKDKKKFKKAVAKGWEIQALYEKMLHYGLESQRAIECAIQGREEFIEKNPLDESKINIALISHGYNIFDEQASMKVIQKLRKMGANVYFAGELSKEEAKQGFENLDTGLYWANEYEMTGAAGFYMNDPKIDGLISITSFGCGPDSIMIERMTRYAKTFKKPLLNLTIDEHTGEAGFITRLEAFTDMIFRTKRVKKMKMLAK
ncbi:MAG: acyl-CoA dehydratase activase-related protein, partial [Candidatus Gastranaerophilales bacterium]|nr:acyl-CoA dehydratase activase-related protein [Candidatus Gastranaerophilales bacterium]